MNQNQSPIHLTFAGPVDESQATEVLEPTGAFPVVTNARQNKRGGIDKRLGFASLSRSRIDGTTRSTGNRLLSVGNSHAVINGSTIEHYSETVSQSTLPLRLPEATVQYRNVGGIGTGTGATLSGSIAVDDAVKVGNYIVTAVKSGPDLYISVETLDGVVMVPATLAYSGASYADPVSLAAYGNYVVIVACASASANIYAYYVDCTNQATVYSGVQSIGTIATDKLNPSSAMLLHGQTSDVVVAYVNNSAGTSPITLKTITYSGVVTTSTVNVGAIISPSFIGLGGDSSTLWVSWIHAPDLKVEGRSAGSIGTITVTSGTVMTVGSGVGPINTLSGPSSGQVYLVVNNNDWKLWTWGSPNVPRTSLVQFADVDGSGGSVSVTNTALCLGANICAKPFRIGTRLYGLFSNGPDIDPGAEDTAVLCDWTDTIGGVGSQFMRPVAVAFPGLVRFNDTRRRVSNVISYGSGQYAYILEVAKSAVGSAAQLAIFNFNDGLQWQTTTTDEIVYLTSGMLTAYDGVSPSDAAFVHRPHQPTTNTGSAGGITGTFRYVQTFERVDGKGNWIVSSVSNPSEAKTVSNTTCNVNYHTSSMCAAITSETDDPRVKVGIYRTANGGEPPYYWLTSERNSSSTPGSASYTYVDNITDATLTTRRLLLGTGNLPGTNGAQQDRRCPPPCQDICLYNGMVVLACDREIWYSAQRVYGEAPWFSPIFSIELPERIVAIRELDGTLYAFSRGAVYALVGEPPSDNGAIGGISAFRRLSSDVGCIDPGSAVATSAGIFFQSERGIELLNRGGAVVWVGEPIQDTLATYPIVSSAILDDKEGLVRFTLATSRTTRVTGPGRTIVYDLAMGGWVSVDTVYGQSANEAAQDARMCVVSGQRRYCWLGTDGYVYHERLPSDASAYLDGSNWITLSVESAWFKLGGMQGKQYLNKVLVLARKVTDFNISVSLAYNYESGWRSARTYTHSEVSSLLSSGWPITQLRHDGHNDAECQSFRVKITDATPTSGTVGSGMGARWLGLTADVAQVVGTFDVPSGAV